MRALLLAHPPVAALLNPASVVLGTVPPGVIPAIGIKEISRTEFATVSRGEKRILVTTRVQVTVYAKSYAAQKELLDAAKLAPGTHRGTHAGTNVKSVLRDVVGPDFTDDDVKLFEQSRDFMVTHTEDN